MKGETMGPRARGEIKPGAIITSSAARRRAMTKHRHDQAMLVEGALLRTEYAAAPNVEIKRAIAILQAMLDERKAERDKKRKATLRRYARRIRSREREGEE
jgi:hypothetical protein